MSSWRWQTQVVGLRSDLEFLVRHFSLGPVRILEAERRDGFVLESETFDTLSTAEEVLARASELLLILSGVLGIERDVVEPLRCGAVLKKHDDGRQDADVCQHETLNARAEFIAGIAYADDPSGRPAIAQPSQPLSVKAVELALRDSAMAKALRLMGRGAKSWGDLYRLYEVLEGDLGGQHRVQSLCWVSETDLRRFKHSANSVSVGGDEARHGRELQQPPPNPMTLPEAESFVLHLLAAWIEQKLHIAS
jgi:hypothetical protein